MKISILFTLAICLTFPTQAQIKNIGSTIIVKSGASVTSDIDLENDAGTIVVDSTALLIVNSNLININAGDIINKGTIEVTGEFTNELGSTLSTFINSTTIILGDEANNPIIPGHNQKALKVDGKKSQ